MKLIDPSRSAPSEAIETGLGEWPPQVAYSAWKARDARLDGRLFVGVTSTGIYCRPVCRVRLPRLENCRFFRWAAQAEEAGFRPCLRCRPELAPGLSRVDMPSELAWAAVRRLDAGALDHGSLPTLAARLGVTDRHLRRVFQRTLGLSPVAYAQTRRLHLAKQMLCDTSLDITQIAFAAGFSSLRRFHAVFLQHYRVPPSEWRRHRRPTAANAPTPEAVPTPGWGFSRTYRPPLDAQALMGFLDARAIPGVERVERDGREGPHYTRTLRLSGTGGTVFTGWVRLHLDTSRHRARVEVSDGLLPMLPAVLAAAHHTADLNADPDTIAATLGPLAQDAPGLRVPGGFDGFELAVRAILGQQVSVRAARTLALRLVSALGEPVETPWPDLNRLFPGPAQLAAADASALGALGLVRSRVKAIQALAHEVLAGRIDLQPGAPVPETLSALEALPGIGPWTARYIALRALGHPDVWLSGDGVLRKVLQVGRDTEAEAEAIAEVWRPWRSYAVLHLWRRAGPTSAGLFSPATGTST